MLALTDTGVTLAEIGDVLLFRGGYNTALVLAGSALIGIAAGVVGMFALLRERALIADALSHAMLPGIGIAFLVAAALGLDGRSLPLLLGAAAASGALGALCVHLLSTRTRLAEDAAIALVLGVFFGAGVVTLSLVQQHAPGGSAGISGFIYGRPATMSERDVAVVGAMALVAVAAAALLAKEFALVSFNAIYARASGWPVGVIDLGLLGLIVLVTVAGLQTTGIIMVVALLIIPAAAARMWTDRLRWGLVLAGVFGAASGYFGAATSAVWAGLPAGAMVVLTAGGLFTLSVLFAPKRGVVATCVRHARSRVRVAVDHVLEAMHEKRAGDEGVREDVLRAFARERGWQPWLRFVVPSVLTRGGWLRTTASGYVLTEAGAARGARISRNHALWSAYLVTYADVAPSHVDWSVDRVEHVLGPELIRELEAAIALREPGRAS